NGLGNGPALTDVGQSVRYDVPSKSRSPIALKNTSHPVTRFGGDWPPCVSPNLKHGASFGSRLGFSLVGSYGPWQLLKKVSLTPLMVTEPLPVTEVHGSKWPISYSSLIM